MAIVFIFAFILYYLFSIVVCQSGNDVTSSFEIVRGKHDSFRNLQCHGSENCTKEQCGNYEAECVNDECKRCRCDKNRATFLVSGLKSGNCTKDEKIVPKSVPEESFMLKNTRYKKCLTRQNETITGTNCSSSLDMRWIWIKHNKKFKLVSVRTLQCLDLQPARGSSDNGNVTLKPCHITDGQNLLINQNSKLIFIKMKNNYYLQLSKESNKSEPAYLASSNLNKSRNSNEKKWSNDDQKLRRTDINYTGCYRFRNEHFMFYLDNDTTCQTNTCSHQFSAPIFMENTNCRVHWANSTISYGGVKWENIEEYFSKKMVENLTFIEKGPSENSKILKIQHEALERFNGTLLKMSISCSNEMKSQNEEHCLLLKFKYLSKKPERRDRKRTDNDPTGPTRKGSTTAAAESTTTANKTMTTVPTTTTTAQFPHKNSKKSPINPLVIAVPVSLLALILVLTLLYFMWYRKRRAQKEPENQGNLNNPMYNSKPVYADPNQRYETPESRIPTATAAPARYEYIDNNDIAKQKKPEPELKYDYAANTDIPRITLNTKSASEEQKYDYATVDTEIPRTTQDTKPEPELKYDYAANTDIPRVILNTKPEPEEQKYGYAAVDTEIPRTTQDTKPAPEELKYDYAVDTDIPRIILDTKPAPEDVADPPGNVHHTLEEPSPPQGAVYSTLEDPATETNPLVTYDTPHSGDPVYNVLEDAKYSNP